MRGSELRRCWFLRLMRVLLWLLSLPLELRVRSSSELRHVLLLCWALLVSAARLSCRA